MENVRGRHPAEGDTYGTFTKTLEMILRDYGGITTLR